VNVVSRGAAVNELHHSAPPSSRPPCAVQMLTMCSLTSLYGSLHLLPTPLQDHAGAAALGQQQQRQLVCGGGGGVRGPEGQALSRPAVLEGEAIARAIRLAWFVGVVLYVVLCDEQ